MCHKNQIMLYEHCKHKNLGVSVEPSIKQWLNLWQNECLTKDHQYDTSIVGLWSNSTIALFPTPTHDSPCCLLYHQMDQISIAVLLLHSTIYVQVLSTLILLIQAIYIVGLLNPNQRKELQAAEKRCESLINQTKALTDFILQISKQTKRCSFVLTQ